MAIERLIELGFSNAVIVGEDKKQITVKVRTSKGWTYEKFLTSEMPVAVDAWAKDHTPE